MAHRLKNVGKRKDLKAYLCYMYSIVSFIFQYVCKNEDYLGGNLELDEDGAYYLCKDENIWPFPTQSSHPCLVYSFGISWDFKFDDAIAKLGCEVHAFDPCKLLKQL